MELRSTNQRRPQRGRESVLRSRGLAPSRAGLFAGLWLGALVACNGGGDGPGGAGTGGASTAGAGAGGAGTAGSGTAGADTGGGGGAGGLGAGGSGAGGASPGQTPVCVPGTQVLCYSASLSTVNVGTCAPGAQVCNEEGTGFGPCEGEVTPKPDDCATPEDEDCDGAPAVCLAPGDLQWSKRFGFEWVETARSIAVDANNNILLTGTADGIITFGGATLLPDSDVFLAKLDPSGGHIFSKTFPGSTYEYGRGVAVDAAGNIFIVGTFSINETSGSIDLGGGALTSAGYHDIFLAKFHPSGDLLWSKRFGGAGTENGEAVAVDSQGNVFIVGDLGSSVDFGGGPLTSQSGASSDAFIAKLDPDGNHLWSKRLDDEDPAHTYSASRGRAVAVSDGGSVVLAGQFKGTLSLGGPPLSAPGMSSSNFVAKLGPDGSHIWSKSFGSEVDFFADTDLGLSSSSSGEVVLTGHFLGQIDFGGGPLLALFMNTPEGFVAKLGANGEHIFSKDLDEEYGMEAALDAAGSTLLLSSSVWSQGISPSHYAFITKLDLAGAPVWSKSFFAGGITGFDIAADGADNVIATGTVSGAVDFGDGINPGASGGERDIYVLKFAP